MLFNTNQAFELGLDAGVYEGFSHIPNASGLIFAEYPTEAIRKLEDTIYTVYDTDTGYRLFLYFKSVNGCLYLQGYPIVYGGYIEYSKFDKLNIGDPIESVIEVDPITKLYRKQIIDIWKLDYKGAKYDEEHGMPLTSLHYLKDGLLKIEYEMLESGELLITNIIYSKDRILKDILGNDINYNILEIDLAAS